MSKPDDIPQDVWEAAREATGSSHDWMGPHDVKIFVARAILATKSEEREACAQVGDRIARTYVEAVKELPADHYKVPYRLHRQNAAIEVSAAIRKRGEA